MWRANDKQCVQNMPNAEANRPQQSLVGVEDKCYERIFQKHRFFLSRNDFFEKWGKFSSMFFEEKGEGKTSVELAPTNMYYIRNI